MRDLAGARIFVSASFPSGPRGEAFRPYDSAAVAEAVTAVTHAVLLSGGRLVFGAHPTVSPLVLLVARELRRPEVIEIYQSEWFEDRVPQETLNLAEEGFGVLRWTPAVPGDDADDVTPSLHRMRDEMFGDGPLAAAIFVGGMEGIFDEYDRLAAHQPSTPRLPLLAPGGAARRLEPSTDPIAERLGPVLGSSRYPSLAREIVTALGGD